SCAGPTASCVEGGGATMIGGAEVAAPESWASAGAAKPVASAMAAGITRNLALIVTRSTGSEAPRALAAATQSLLPSICRHFKHMLDEPQATGDENVANRNALTCVDQHQLGVFLGLDSDLALTGDGDSVAPV